MQRPYPRLSLASHRTCSGLLILQQTNNMKYSFIFLSIILFASSCQEEPILETSDPDPQYASLEIQLLYQQVEFLVPGDITIEIYRSKEDAIAGLSPVSTHTPTAEGKVNKSFLDVNLHQIYIRVDERHFGTYIGVETLRHDVVSYHLIEFFNGYYYDSDDLKLQAPKTVSLERPMVGQKSLYERFVASGYIFEVDEILLGITLTVEVIDYVGNGQYVVSERESPINCLDGNQEFTVVNIWQFKNGIVSIMPKDSNELIATSYLFALKTLDGVTLDYVQEDLEMPAEIIKDNAPGYYRFSDLDLEFGNIKSRTLSINTDPVTGNLGFFQFFTTDLGIVKTFTYSLQKVMQGYRLVSS